MEIIKLLKNKYTKFQIDLTVDYFKLGKIVVLPTDTIYGLSCDATNEKAIKKIIKLKKRNKNKGLIILVSNLEMVKKYCAVDKATEMELLKMWKTKRPTTVLLKQKGKLPKILSGGSNSLALRLPKRKNIVKMIDGVGAPLVSTSLNLSGGMLLSNVRQVQSVFNAELIDLAVDCGDVKNKRPSRIVDLTDIKNTKIIRS